MNYIPGFSNYLEASVPEYGPAPIVDAEPVTPQRAMVEPMTQEAVAPYDLSGLGLSEADLAKLYALSANNAGGSSGGMAGLPSMGGLGANYVDMSGAQLITAPTSNKGNPTAYGADNQFYVQPNELVRVVDRSTNSVIFEGVGPDAAREAVKIGQNMTDTMGRKADYQIQAGLTPDNYQPVTNEKYNKSTAGKIAGAVGTALPLAMAFVPGLNLGVLGSIGAGAGVGGASAALKGDNILKGAAMGGLSAAGGQLLGPVIGDAANVGLRAGTAIGTGIGSTAGGVLTGQSLKNALLGGVVSGGLSYLAPDVTKGLGIGGGSSVNASTGGDGFTGINVVGSAPASISTSLGGSQNKIQQALKPKTEAPYDGLTVTGGKFGSVGFGGDQFGTPGQDTSAFEKMYSEPYDPNEILVKASPLEQAAPVSVPITGALDTDIVVNALGKEKGLPEGSVLADLGIPQVPAPDPALTKKPLGIEDYLSIAGKIVPLLGAGGGKDGSDQTGTYGGAGNGRLNPIFSAKLPAAGGLGAVGVNRTLRPVGEQDWLTYGERPELNFYDYVARPNPAPVAQPAISAPVTTPVLGNPAGPAMYAPDTDNMRFAEGGAMPAKHGGRSQRTEFAVNGPGTGRSDDIPAVLSDGEYVIDAETVALLGDGSSKAGAKKLDDLRVKVRKHKGKKLAKGRFSANAKKPEAYLSGGRI